MKIKILIGLLVLGISLASVGGFILARQSMSNQDVKTAAEKNLTPPTVIIPEELPVFVQDLNYLMQGKREFLYIYADGTIIHTVDTGLRMPHFPPIRTWQTGNLEPAALSACWIS